MNNIVDNLIAYRILSMLVKPFAETDAYKLGIIDENGEVLIKAKNLKTSAQKNAYNYLTRLVFNLKRLLNKLPGGESKLKNIVAAFFLVKESYQQQISTIDEQQLIYIINLLENSILVEEQLIVEDFLDMMSEDGIANVTGPGVSTDIPVVKPKRRRFARFTVKDNVYDKFSEGKAKFRKWSSYLNMEDEGESQIYNYIKDNPKGVIILHNGKNTKIIHSNRK